jgi:hypothetical protein
LTCNLDRVDTHPYTPDAIPSESKCEFPEGPPAKNMSSVRRESR